MATVDVWEGSRHKGLHVFLRRSARLVLLVLGFLVVAVILLVVLNRYFLEHIVNPEFVDIHDVNASHDELGFNVSLEGESGTMLDRYQVNRANGIVAVEIVVMLRGFHGQGQDKFSRITIDIGPQDQSVVLTDGRTERLIWSRKD